MRELGEGDPEIALTLLWFGECQFHQAKYEDAEQNLQKAYTLQKIKYGEKDENLERVLRLLYDTLDALGKHEEAHKIKYTLGNLNK